MTFVLFRATIRLREVGATSNDLYPIVYDNNHYTVMANDIVKGKQDMTLQEARILRLMITQVAREDKDLKTYTCNIKDLARFLGISSQNLYRDISTICDNLLQRIVRVGTGNPREPWEKFQWIQLAKYDGNGTLTLMLSEQIRPFVLDLDRYFTRYRLENILYMGSFYAIRLYELLRCDDYMQEDFVEYSIDYLRSFFECEKKYAAFKDFKVRVIEIAVKEINDKSDIKIEKIEYLKTGRRYTRVRFFISEPAVSTNT